MQMKLENRTILLHLNHSLFITTMTNKCSQVGWCTPVIPALRRLRHEDCKFEASLSYKSSPCFNQPTNQTNKQKTK
jgi:hypothetical protein